MNENSINNEKASEIFTSYALPYIMSADGADTMMNFSAIAITAWNLAGENDEFISNGVQRLETRLKCKELFNFGQKESIHNSVHTLIKKKCEIFSQFSFKIAGAQFEQEGERLQINVKLAE